MRPRRRTPAAAAAPRAGANGTAFYAANAVDVTAAAASAPANAAANHPATAATRPRDGAAAVATTSHARRFRFAARRPRHTLHTHSCRRVAPRAALSTNVHEVAAALAGGTVGVLGTLITLESVRKRVSERKNCPYCAGRGRLVCGECCALGSVPERLSASGCRWCDTCAGKGYVQCNHCEGSGRLLPIEYERAMFQQYEDEWLNDGMFH